MNTDPSLADSIAHINLEMQRIASAEHGLPLAEVRSALPITDACSTFRSIRGDLDDCIIWLEAHAPELVPLVRLLIRIADAACRAPRGSGG